MSRVTTPHLLVKHSIDRALVHSHTCSYFRTYSLAVEIEMSLYQYFNNQPANTQLPPTQTGPW